MEMSDTLHNEEKQSLSPLVETMQNFSIYTQPSDNSEGEGTQTLGDVASFVKDTISFFDSQQFSDVVIRVGETVLPAHKFVLSKSSRVFQTMLYEPAWGAGKELQLEETPECQAVFKTFVKFLYCGEVEVRLDSAVGLLCLADKYEVESLKCLVAGFMLQWARSPRLHNALLWYHWAKLFHLSELQLQCFRTIAWNFGEVVAGDEWARMSIDFIVDLVSSSELVISDEMVVYQAVLAWLGGGEGRIEKHSQTLLPLVRFPQMQVSQLFQLEKSSHCPVVASLLSQAYRYRAICPEQKSLGAIFDGPSYLPRDYTYLCVDTVKVQNTMRFGIQSDVKSARSAVPSESKEADWKITYRKQSETWAMQLYSLDTALNNAESKVHVTVLVYNHRDQVLQVQREDTNTCSRGACVNIHCSLPYEEMPSHLAILIKPVPL